MDLELLTRTWLPQFGAIDVQAPDIIDVGTTSPVGSQFHAEAHHGAVLGADFRYSALLEGDWTKPGLSGHLQFRISDEGRYGVRVQAGVVTLYSFVRRDRDCSDDPDVIAHCPKWGEDPDEPVEEDLGSAAFQPMVGALRVTVEAVGTRLSVSLDAAGTTLGTIMANVADEGPLGVGRFGIYVLSDKESSQVVFRDLTATTDPTAASNFALLYSTPGYDVTGSKRVLVRTLNEVQPADVDVAKCSFSVVDMAGFAHVRDQAFQPASEPGLARSLGMQVLQGDFSDLQDAGSFTLKVRIATSSGVRELDSEPFEVRSRLVSETMLWPLTIANAQARRAADDDFRRNWHIESGPQCWSVGLDGAFIADRADDNAGATLRRIFNIANTPLDVLGITDFRFVCRITIVHGCDAQLQFRITPTQRWAVTLQAGDAGGCTHGTGPGAVRLHREGPGVNHPNHFQVVASHRLDATPFRVGRAYDIEVRATGKRIEVILGNGERVIDFTDSAEPAPGTFALKAWSATVRFGHAKVWARHVALSHRAPGVWIPYDPGSGLSSQGFDITVPDDDHIVGPPRPDDVWFPLAAQQHGFNDCNNSIGEVTSHSVFLAGLMAVWQSRAAQAGPLEQDNLRQAILTAVLYLNELYEQGNRSGAFTHQEPGRGALNPVSDKVLTTKFALYGLSSFAATGLAVDKRYAERAFDLAAEAWNWLDGHAREDRDITVDSVAAIRLALAADRQGRTAAGEWFERAHDLSKRILAHYSQPGAMANAIRDTLRSIPWFEGVYETFTAGPISLDDSTRSQLVTIADQLEALMDNPANAFRIVPQSDPRNWNDLTDLPFAVRPIPEPPDPPVGDWYLCEHFVTAAADCCYIGRLTGRGALEQLATGNLYWALGLNPGIPTTKTVRSADRSEPWRAASFVYNGPGVFARTIEGFRLKTKSAKGWLATWEVSPRSRHRETWWFDPAPTGFQSIVNGHVLREDQWHYWSNGIAGWVSGEVFMLIDGSFVRAALAIEDWRAGTTAATATPYDLSRLRFFDTTHLDRASTRWTFDDPDITDWALAQRMSTGFAAEKGYRGGRPTGHHLGERVGVLCLPDPATTFVDIRFDEIATTQFPFRDINDAHWTQIGRAAVEIAANHGFATGYFTGHQNQQVCSWVGIRPELVTIFDIANDDPDVTGSPWKFADINSVHWAQAARLATDICNAKGFAGGFFTGHQIPGQRQVAALRSP